MSPADTVERSIFYPVETNDHSAFMLGHGLAGRCRRDHRIGTTFIDAVSSASEFGVAASGKTMAGLLVWLHETHSLDPPAAHGMILTSAHGKCPAPARGSAWVG